MPGAAMTVTGQVPSGDLGVTLIHEHLRMDISPMLATYGYPERAPVEFAIEHAAEARWNPGAYMDNVRFTDVDLVIKELEPFRRAGGRTVVDLTLPDIGRDPAALRKIAESTGLNVVMGCGWYLQPTQPKDLVDRTAEELATELVKEIREGVGQLSIRPGIIGEIGTSSPVHPDEIKVLRAAAMAHRETGLSVTVHLQPWSLEGHAVLDALLAEGTEPERIVLGHLNTAYREASYLRSLLDRGVRVEFDLFGFDHSLFGLGRYPPSDAEVANTLAALVTEGYGDRVLLSQDIGVRTRLLVYGGWGYAHLLEHVVPILRDRGLGDSDVERLLVTNPAEVLAVQEK